MRVVKLDQILFLVLDEADRMLDMGIYLSIYLSIYICMSTPSNDYIPPICMYNDRFRAPDSYDYREDS